MDNKGNTALGNGTIDRLSPAECELLYTLARMVPVGQAIVALNGEKNEAATWLSRGANEATGNKVHSVNMRDTKNKLGSWRWKAKVGLLWYNASCEYEDVRKTLLSWQGRLSPGAKIVLRGYEQPGVARVIKEYIGAYGNLIFVDSVGIIAVLEVGGCVHYWVIDCKELGICKYCGKKRNFRWLRGESSEIETQRRANGRKSK